MAVDYDETERNAMVQAFSQPAMGRELVKDSGGQSLPSLEIVDGIVTARRCEVQRDEGRIIQKINVLAAWAGEEWFYSWEVNDRRRGRKVTVEGLSIDGADALARLWGNCMVDCRVVDGGDSFILYGKFVDLETGYTLIRPFMQNKAASKMQTEDEARKRDMALSMGVSKCERNVVIHALKFFAEHALREAKKNLVGRVGKDHDGFKQRIADKLAELEVAVDRVERIVGRPIDKWTVPDTAKIYAEVRTVADGMALPEDVWPVAPPPEPRRSDAKEASAAAAPPGSGTAAAPPANGGGGPATQSDETPSPPEEQAASPASSREKPPKSWRLPDNLVGQDAVWKALGDLLDGVENEAELDQLLEQNSERLLKITGMRRSEWLNKVRTKREQVKGAKA